MLARKKKKKRMKGKKEREKTDFREICKKKVKRSLTILGIGVPMCKRNAEKTSQLLNTPVWQQPHGVGIHIPTYLNRHEVLARSSENGCAERKGVKRKKIGIRLEKNGAIVDVFMAEMEETVKTFALTHKKKYVKRPRVSRINRIQ